jgi:UPF0755 protein
MRWLIASTLAIVATAGLVVATADYIYQAPGPLGQAAEIVVPRGGVGAVADALVRAGVIRHRSAFEAAAIVTSPEGPLHAAELSFPAGASIAEVLAVLRFGHAIQHHVTIPEGLTAAQISIIVMNADGLVGDLAVPAEGSVLPNTYDYTRGTARDALIARAQQAMRVQLAASWRTRAPNLPLHSEFQALILASIVEREAKLPVERPMIARAFLNRLSNGMKLQADPTAVYGASGGAGNLDRALAHQDLSDADSYNTYEIDGLPAGPICSPGAAAIAAVLHPAAGDALYFVSDGTGGHVFATSLGAHNQNVTRLREGKK